MRLTKEDLEEIIKEAQDAATIYKDEIKGRKDAVEEIWERENAKVSKITRDELEGIIGEAQHTAQGCGCCESDDYRREGLESAVEEIWKRINDRK